jgi:NinB protein
VTERKSFYLHSPRIRENAVDAIRAADVDAVVTIAPKGRTGGQNAKMWAMLTDVAEAKPEGRQWTPETWKAAFMHYLGHQVMFAEGLDGSGPFPLGFRTSALSAKHMSDLITCIYQYGDEHGVAWTETEKCGFGERNAA